MQAYFDYTTKRLDDNSKVILVEGLPCIGKTEVAKGLAEELGMKHFPMVTMDSYYINAYGYDMRKLDPQIPSHLRSFSLEDFIKVINGLRVIMCYVRSRTVFLSFNFRILQTIELLSYNLQCSIKSSSSILMGLRTC